MVVNCRAQTDPMAAYWLWGMGKVASWLAPSFRLESRGWFTLTFPRNKQCENNKAEPLVGFCAVWWRRNVLRSWNRWKPTNLYLFNSEFNDSRRAKRATALRFGYSNCDSDVITRNDFIYLASARLGPNFSDINKINTQICERVRERRSLLLHISCVIFRAQDLLYPNRNNFCGLFLAVQKEFEFYFLCSSVWITFSSHFVYFCGCSWIRVSICEFRRWICLVASTQITAHNESLTQCTWMYFEPRKFNETKQETTSRRKNSSGVGIRFWKIAQNEDRVIRQSQGKPPQIPTWKIIIKSNRTDFILFSLSTLVAITKS